jgi:uncharacterized zinc-type alcohol dehydrogenase-like protein
MCANAKATIVGRHGGFADKVRAQTASVIKPTDSVAVIGIGGLGHYGNSIL